MKNFGTTGEAESVISPRHLRGPEPDWNRQGNKLYGYEDASSCTRACNPNNIDWPQVKFEELEETYQA